MVIKDSNSLYIIYLTILSEVLVGRVVLNFYIYKELFGLINLTLKIFYAFILNQEALKVGHSDLIISDISCTLAKLVIYPLLLIKGVLSWLAIWFLINIALLLVITLEWTFMRTSTFTLWLLIIPFTVLPTIAIIYLISPVIIILVGFN